MSVKVNALPVEANPALTDSTINDSVNIVTKRTTWQKIFDWVVTSGIMSGTYASGISAAGVSQATATAISATFNRVDSVAAGTGVKNSAASVAGETRMVQNNGANDLLWYPFGADQFYLTDGSGLQGASVPITIASGNSAKFICYNAGQLTIQG